METKIRNFWDQIFICVLTSHKVESQGPMKTFYFHLILSLASEFWQRTKRTRKQTSKTFYALQLFSLHWMNENLKVEGQLNGHDCPSPWNVILWSRLLTLTIRPKCIWLRKLRKWGKLVLSAHYFQTAHQPGRLTWNENYIHGKESIQNYGFILRA